MNLITPKEPLQLREFMETLKREHGGDPRIRWDSFIVWSGNQLPKYLWNEWKGELKANGFMWQSFLKILRQRTDIVLLWFADAITWEAFVEDVIVLLESPLATQINKTTKVRERRPQPMEFFVNVPVYGTANAGTPTAIAEQRIEGYVAIPKRVIGLRTVFAVRIDGDSLNLATVNGKTAETGDYAIIESDGEWQDRDPLLVTIDGAATVKLFSREGDRIKLLPYSSNKNHQPIYLDEASDAQINGKIIDVIKSQKEK